MTIKEYTIIPNGKCCFCGDTESVVIDEEGDEVCTDCIFERECDTMYNDSEIDNWSEEW